MGSNPAHTVHTHYCVYALVISKLIKRYYKTKYFASIYVSLA